MQSRNQAVWVEKNFGVCGIYLITHTPSESVYVGSSISCGRRWAEHVVNLNRGRHNKEMLALWQSSTPEDWTFKIYKTLPNGSDDELLLKEEIDAWSQLHGQGTKLLNGRPYGRGNARKPEVKKKIAASHTGQKRPESTKKKMSESHTGKKRGPYKKRSGLPGGETASSVVVDPTAVESDSTLLHLPSFDKL